MISRLSTRLDFFIAPAIIFYPELDISRILFRPALGNIISIKNLLASF
jgi:hypothetical protein